MRSLIAFFLACVFVSGFCGCHKSGKWKDDPNNWKRAFGTSPPKEIEIVHSIYWRTPHFTREDGWTFDIKSAPSFYKKWLATYKVKHPDFNELKTVEFLKNDKPSWFVPKPLTEYEIWILADNPDASFALFVDRTTGEWFVTDSG